MTTPTIGLLAGLLLTIAATTGGLGGLLLALLLGAGGYVAGAQLSGDLDLRALGRGDRS